MEMNEEMIEKKYNEAVDLLHNNYDDEKIAQARDIFKDLGDYKRSEEFLEKCERYLEYQVGKVIEFGHLNGKPITWKILYKNGSDVLVFATDHIGYHQWNTERDHTVWVGSSLRRWLNKDFVSEAFTLKENMMVILKQLINNQDPRWYSDNGPNTRDKVFVFNRQELDEYVPNIEDRAINEWYWLRGHGDCLLALQAVYNDGTIYDIGVNKNATDVAVRPAMWIRLPM